MIWAKHSNSNKGFTLIEIVMVVVVLGILSVFTFSFIDDAVKTYTIGSKQRMLYQEAAYVMERITREARDAQTIIISDAGTDHSTIDIQKAHPTLMDTTNTRILFQRSGTDLRRLYPSSGGQIIGSKVTEFRVDSEYCSASCSGADEKGKITIRLTLTDPSIPINDPAAQAVTLTTTISPRNYVTNQYNDRCLNGGYEDVIQ